MTALAYTAAQISASREQGAIINNYQAGGTVSVGQAVYLDSNNKVQAADSNASLAASRAIGVVVNTQSLYGETSVAANGYVSVCVFGPVFGFTSVSGFAYGYVDTTAGQLNDAAPATAHIWILGYFTASGEFFVSPGTQATSSVA